MYDYGAYILGGFIANGAKEPETSSDAKTRGYAATDYIAIPAETKTIVFNTGLNDSNGVYYGGAWHHPYLNMYDDEKNYLDGVSIRGTAAYGPVTLTEGTAYIRFTFYVSDMITRYVMDNDTKQILWPLHTIVYDDNNE